jgi:hypothetical protein
MSEVEALRLQETCQSISDWLNRLGPVLMIAANGVVPVAAVFLAAPIVSSELELGTATLAWVLARNRRSWLLPRVALVLVVPVGLALVIGLMVDVMSGQFVAPASPWASMAGYDLRGAIIPARVVLIVAAALFAGALAGRQVPALLLGVALSGALILGVAGADNALNLANAVRLDGPGLHMNSVPIEVATGRTVTWDEIWAATPQGTDPFASGVYDTVAYGIPDADAPLVMARNVAMYLVLAVPLLFATFVIVERRRPY